MKFKKMLIGTYNSDVNILNDLNDLFYHVNHLTYNFFYCYCLLIDDVDNFNIKIDNKFKREILNNNALMSNYFTETSVINKNQIYKDHLKYVDENLKLGLSYKNKNNICYFLQYRDYKNTVVFRSNINISKSTIQDNTKIITESNFDTNFYLVDYYLHDNSIVENLKDERKFLSYIQDYDNINFIDHDLNLHHKYNSYNDEITTSFYNNYITSDYNFDDINTYFVVLDKQNRIDIRNFNNFSLRRQNKETVEFLDKIYLLNLEVHKDDRIYETDVNLIEKDKDFKEHVLMNRFSPRLASENVGVYILDKKQVNLLVRELYDSSIQEEISKFFLGDLKNAIMSLKWFYSIKNHLKTKKERSLIVLGKHKLSLPDENENTRSKSLESEFCYFEIEPFNILKKYNNFLDYEPFTNIQIYIPFLGYRKLNCQEVMGKELTITYSINVITAECLVNVLVKVDENRKICILAENSQIGIDIPLWSESMGSMMTNLARFSAKTASVAGTVISVANPVIGGALAGGGSLVNTIFDSVPNSESSLRNGSFNSDTHSLNDFNVKVLIERTEPINLEMTRDNYSDVTYEETILENLEGYVEIEKIKNKDNKNENIFINEIEEILKQGIII